ncbi:hypothetical protein ACF0H5_019710 [Mactra antiquata]
MREKEEIKHTWNNILLFILHLILAHHNQPLQNFKDGGYNQQRCLIGYQTSANLNKKRKSCGKVKVSNHKSRASYSEVLGTPRNIPSLIAQRIYSIRIAKLTTENFNYLISFLDEVYHYLALWAILQITSNTSSHSDDSDIDDVVDGNINKSKHNKRNSKKGKKQKMPLFRKQSTNAKKRQDHQQYLAKENPEPVIDLSNCEIDEHRVVLWVAACGCLLVI